MPSASAVPPTRRLLPGPVSLMKLIRFLFRYSPGLIVMATLVGIGGGLASTAVLAIINRHLRGVATGNGRDLWLFCVLCLAILLTNLVARVSIAGLSQWSAFDLRLQLGRKWIAAPLEDLEQRGNGQILAAVTQDVERLSDAMHALPGLCIDATVIAACLGYLAFLSWWALLVMVGFIAVAILTRRIPEKRCETLLGEAREHGGALLATFNAMSEGIKELKMNRRRWSAFYAGELYQTSVLYRDKNYSAETIYGLIRGYSEIIYFLFVGLLIYGGRLRAGLSLEIVIGFAVTLLYMKTNIDHIQDSVSQIVRADVALRNLESLQVFAHVSSLSLRSLRQRTTQSEIAREVEGDAGPLAEPRRELARGLIVRDLEYRYPSSEEEEESFSIGPVDLEIKSGEILFIVGGNGSGKTTFAKVLCGLYEPMAGAVFLDGEPIVAGNRTWYAQHFGTVFADPHLFEKLYGTEGLPATDDMVREYLSELRLDGKVTVENGRFSTIALSHGQRKRLSLVAAYLEDRPLYLFDEWAADQDPEFRNVFYHSILPGLKARGKAVIVISHDDRYYGVADRILKFESGRVVSEPAPALQHA